jgi:hypothetical protein
MFSLNQKIPNNTKIPVKKSSENEYSKLVIFTAYFKNLPPKPTWKPRALSEKGKFLKFIPNLSHYEKKKKKKKKKKIELLN